MNIYLYWISEVCFFISSVYAMLTSIRYWQKNQYTLLSLKKLWMVLSNKAKVVFVGKLLLLVSFFLIAFFDTFSLLYQVLLTAYFISQSCWVIIKLFRKTIRFPFWNAQAISVLVLSLLLLYICIFFSLTSPLLWLLCLDILLPFLTQLSILLISFPLEIYEDVIITIATRSFRKRKYIFLLTDEPKIFEKVKFKKAVNIIKIPSDVSFIDSLYVLLYNKSLSATIIIGTIQSLEVFKQLLPITHPKYILFARRFAKDRKLVRSFKSKAKIKFVSREKYATIDKLL